MAEVIALVLTIVFVLAVAYWLMKKVTGWGGFT